MKEMTLDEFKREYMNNKETKWNFNLFKIVCKKCGSDMVEFNGAIEAEVESGYYPGEDEEGIGKGIIIVKCHKCGNAFKIEIDTHCGGHFKLNKNGKEYL